MRRPARVVLAALAGLVTIAGMYGARAVVEEVVTADGAPGSQRRLALADGGPAAPPVERAARVRVVVIDGLRRREAHGPGLDGLCARGLDLVIDVGFPTKSLPVQSVLWTGLTAQQSGVAMRNELPRPVAGALPARVPGSVAIVESWPSIAEAMGFAHVVAGDTGFEASAKAAVASDAALVMVHVLAVDAAGHAHGVGEVYRTAAAAADALVAGLHARAPEAAWLVLSDHGHLAGGGHGDVEDEVRRVRGCISPRPPGAPAQAEVHLVDVSRHLHQWLGVEPSPRAVGRAIVSASRTLDRDATLPRPGVLAVLAALVVVGGGMVLTWRRARPRWAAFAMPAAFAAYVAICGFPTLSARAPGVALALGGGLALALLAVRGRAHLARVMALTVPSGTAALAGALLAGLPARLLGVGEPPRLPFVTATSQIVTNLSTVPLLVGVVLAVWVLSGSRTVPRPEPGRCSSGGSDQPVRASDSGHAG